MEIIKMVLAAAILLAAAPVVLMALFDIGSPSQSFLSAYKDASKVTLGIFAIGCAIGAVLWAVGEVFGL